MKINPSRVYRDILLDFLRLLVTPLRGTVSVLEFVVIVVCLLAVGGVIANGWDIYHERKRAYIGNGAKLTLSNGAWRRVIADGLQILAYLSIGVVSAIAPTSTVTQAQTRSAAVTLLLLAILGAVVYNQANDYLTRRKATIQLDELYDRIHVAEIPRTDD